MLSPRAQFGEEISIVGKGNQSNRSFPNEASLTEEFAAYKKKAAMRPWI